MVTRQLASALLFITTMATAFSSFSPHVTAPPSPLARRLKQLTGTWDVETTLVPFKAIDNAPPLTPEAKSFLDSWNKEHPKGATDKLVLGFDMAMDGTYIRGRMTDALNNEVAWLVFRYSEDSRLSVCLLERGPMGVYRGAFKDEYREARLAKDGETRSILGVHFPADDEIVIRKGIDIGSSAVWSVVMKCKRRK